MTPLDSRARNYTTVEEFQNKVSKLQWKGHYVVLAPSQKVPTTVQLRESSVFLWVRVKIYAFLSYFSHYYTDKYNKHAHRPLRTYTINLVQEPQATEVFNDQKLNDSQLQESQGNGALDAQLIQALKASLEEEKALLENSQQHDPPLTGDFWLDNFPPSTGKPAESPFRDSFFKTLPDDLSTLGPLSELESQALKSVQTLTELLGLKGSLSELPKFPWPIDSVDGLWDLQLQDKLATIKDPVSFGFDGDGWPFVVIKVLDGNNLDIARSIRLYCGPEGCHYIKWNGWWEHHNGSSCPSFFSRNIFILPTGELLPYKIVPAFKDLLTKGSGVDDYGKKWVLYQPKLEEKNL